MWISRGGWVPKDSPQQAAVGPQGPGGTLKIEYSARERLKALVSNLS
jgi:hypothetical protein